MTYRIQVGGGIPVVVDDDGEEVPNSYVHEIRFPHRAMTGPDSNISVIAGPGSGDATVEGERLSDLPLC